MRKISYKYHSVDKATKQPCIISGQGLFHAWGVGFEEFESGPGNYSVAIIELKNGQIITVEADCVKFIKEDNHVD